jgi:hypothetical protein
MTLHLDVDSGNASDVALYVSVQSESGPVNKQCTCICKELPTVVFDLEYIIVKA